MFTSRSDVKKIENRSAFGKVMGKSRVSCFLDSRDIRHAKLQSNRHHQQTNIQLFTGRIPFLSPKQQCQSTEGENITFHGVAHSELSGFLFWPLNITNITRTIRVCKISLRGHYSSTVCQWRQLHLKTWDFRRLRKTGSKVADVMFRGRPFQTRASVTGKAQSPMVESRVHRTTRDDEEVERRRRRASWSTGW